MRVQRQVKGRRCIPGVGECHFPRGSEGFLDFVICERERERFGSECGV